MQHSPRRSSRFGALFLFALLTVCVSPSRAQTTVDTALVVAVDVSQSVDEERYRLQLEGIAQALEDPATMGAIVGGEHASIMFSLVVWSDRPELIIGWRMIRGMGDAMRIAGEIRSLPTKGGEFTCVARMLSHVETLVLPSLPLPAARMVVDVSGDGIDNCSRSTETDAIRARLTDAGVTINGLPILVPGENDTVGAGMYRAPGFGLSEGGPERDMTTLPAWYRDHVIGGPGAFLHVARGYEDFARAFRRKFVQEISLDRPAALALGD
jgi:hypothetical protein